MPFLVGIMFIIMGNYMGKIRPNWFMGIRTPWTLSSDEVWNKTHRLGGKLFVLAGALLILVAFLPGSVTLVTLIIGVAAVVIIPTVYSFILFKREKK